MNTVNRPYLVHPPSNLTSLCTISLGMMIHLNIKKPRYMSQ